MKKLRFNIFLLCRRNGGIIFESFDTNKPLNFSFLKLCISFKRIICGNNKFDLRDLMVTYGIHARSLMFLLFTIFDSKFKTLLFPFHFYFKVYSVNNTFKEKFIGILIEIIVNIWIALR